MGFQYISYWVLVCASAVYGAIHFKKLDRSYKALSVLLIAIAISEVISRVLAYSVSNTSYVYHFLLPIIMIANGVIYFNLFPKGSWYRAYTIGFTLIALLGSAYSSLFYDEFDKFPTFGLQIASLQIVPFSLLLFYNMLQKPSDILLHRQKEFWLNLGNLIFYTITFFVFAYNNYFVYSASDRPAWFAHVSYAANITLYSSYLASLYFQVLEKNYLSSIDE